MSKYRCDKCGIVNNFPGHSAGAICPGTMRKVEDVTANTPSPDADGVARAKQPYWALVNDCRHLQDSVTEYEDKLCDAVDDLRAEVERLRAELAEAKKEVKG